MSSTPLLLREKNKTEEPSEMLAYLLAFYINNPGQVSSFYDGDLVSFTKTAAAYGHNKQEMCDRVQEELLTAIRELFDDHRIEVTATVMDEQENGFYTVRVTFEGYVGNSQISLQRKFRHDKNNQVILSLSE